MESREELETKGISQLMAERFAKGVPRGAYSNNSFEKATQDVSVEEFTDEVIPKVADQIRGRESGGVGDTMQKYVKDAEDGNLKTAAAGSNKSIRTREDIDTPATLTADLVNGTQMTDADFAAKQKAIKKEGKASIDAFYNLYFKPYVPKIVDGTMTVEEAHKAAWRDYIDNDPDVEYVGLTDKEMDP